VLLTKKNNVHRELLRRYNELDQLEFFSSGYVWRKMLKNGSVYNDATNNWIYRKEGTRTCDPPPSEE
jgi:hypothetical protein